MTDSSFLSSLPVFQMPKPTDAFPTAPAPTPAFTSPLLSPSQANPPVSFDQWSWNTARLEQDRRPIAEEVSPLTTPVDPPKDSPVSGEGPSSSPETSSNVDGTLAGTTPTSSSIDAPRDSQQFRLPPSPTYRHQPQPNPSFTVQSTSAHTSPLLNTTVGPSKQVNVRSARAKNNSGTFGALPYPEWRLEIVTKAQRAGMGELTKAMDQFIWGDNPGLALLTKELGLSLAPMELIRSPSIRTAAGESIDEGESVDTASTRRQRRRKERKMTLEQENVAMGLDFSAKTIPDPSPQLVQHRLVPSGNSPSERSPTSTLSVGGSYTDSYSTLRLGYVDVDSSESGEESSDAEWVGWMADLHRQAKICREEESQRELLETESVESSTDTYHYWDYQQQDDHRRYQEERRALEPSAIVTSSSPLTVPTSPVTMNTPQTRTRHQPHVSSASTASGSNHVIVSTGAVETNPGPFHRPATPSALVGVLSSPSSNESLGRARGRRLSFGLSPSDPPSSATSPAISQAGLNAETSHHTLEHPNARLNRHQRQISGMVRDGPHLSHYASTGLIGTTTAFIGSLSKEQELSNLTSGRRPSMPTLNLSSSTTLSKGLPSPPMPSANSAGTSSGGWPADSHSATSSITNKLFDHPTIPRRSSTTLAIGSIPSETSLSRSSSMLNKAPGLLRKKDPEVVKKRIVQMEGEQDYERSGRKGKDKGKGKGKEYNFDEEVKFRRPRLSLSMSSSDSRQANIQPLTSGLVNPPTSPVNGRINIGQTLLPSEDRSLGLNTRNKSPPVKKKRGFVGTAEKLLQGLESTLDFVDAR
ncbi:hypothetical protein BDP27DRAFT_1315032 [Rhodocollybia butyracea]|uniref:Uncharacterized protein n=1 Tax=Rhodocollybia butyracea TaxID=206335 RepID=A0A9P5Q4T2_9AGAR|nr:hypothetical protein BDP27DRAFT_1315032 [Rhodocollybia butyracea]